MATSVAVTPEIKYCVVCGAGSHRSDWIKKSGDFVACDKHTSQEVADAVAIKQGKAPAPAVQQAGKPVMTSVPKK